VAGEGLLVDVTDSTLFQREALVCMDAVYRAAVALCGDRAVAEDLAQATYLRAWERFDQFRPGTHCRAWLLRILRNTWIDQLRHRQVAGPAAGQEALEQVPARPEQPESPPVRDRAGWLGQFGDEALIRALAELPEELRLALFLVHLEGYSQQEAAEALEVPVGTIKSRTSRAASMLRRRLEELGHPPSRGGGEP
jgi:RNA polymerase sigma-70 factor, ECF subfamily